MKTFVPIISKNSASGIVVYFVVLGSVSDTYICTTRSNDILCVMKPHTDV